ncbi:pirin family protein [Halomonas sp. KAO]|uniref:pirin family protein n=1 Tax=unclassified Halomonas TaxID=2609666 RepID=UPI00189EE7AC|nr:MULTISPECIES: pirin family protein [unclassified Halomonas]MBF7054983.1 pirin family protein [Halomonas sp. KAO]MDT0501429.1 pirin family protein [Halomonas sp. PAR7]MDT0512897.1 pirin family protein [Halomonas sp. LES1]MDT0591278.1 pirin family protein [Halomonas sp. PAR8]
MSTLTRQPDEALDQDCTSPVGCQAIDLLIEPRDKDLGGFSVRRLLPVQKRRMVGPWIFFDHMGPADFPAGEGINVRPHPHINLATVTYLFEGEILHRDSVGSYQPIRPGDVNLMVAGRGINHSERERPEVTERAHRLNGLQLWLALPEADEETDPAFYHYPDADIPRVEVAGVPIRVIMGSAYGATSPVKVFADTLYVEAHLRAGQSIKVPAAEERAVYVAEGELNTDDTRIPEHAMAVLTDAPDIELTATRDSRIAIVGGQHLGHRHIEWNFVSSRRERIRQAKADWKAQNFPRVAGDEEEFIPFPE